MARSITKHAATKRSRRQVEVPETFLEMERTPARPVVQPLVGNTPGQKKYLSALKSSLLTFATGPAGTGKTYMAAAFAAQQLLDGEVERIIITRPAVEAGEHLGFLPGELEDKFDPYLQPFMDVLHERLGKSHVENLKKNERIVASPLAYMRGHTFKRAFVILDEAQNTTPGQMKLFLTRIGEDCKVVVNGDTGQRDIATFDGLSDAVNRTCTIPGVSIVTMTHRDIVRSGLCQAIVQAYDQ